MDATVPLSFAIAMLAIHGTAMTTLIAALVLLALRLGRLPTREDYNELRNEFRADMAQLREDFRRSHQQIMLALVNHSHRPDGPACVHSAARTGTDAGAGADVLRRLDLGARPSSRRCCAAAPESVR